MLAAGIADATPPSYDYRGTGCSDAIATLHVDAAAARAQIPAQFVIPGESAGTAVMFLTLTRCDLSLDGAPARPVSFSDAGVLIVPPDGVPGLSLYWLWDVTSDASVAQLDAAFGIPTAHLEGIDLAYQSGALTTSASYEVPWSAGAYGASVTYTSVVPPAAPGTVTWWHQGPQGLVRLDQGFQSPDTEAQGLGTITTAPDGMLGRLLGGPSATTEFMLSYADLSATLTVAGP